MRSTTISSWTALLIFLIYSGLLVAQEIRYEREEITDEDLEISMSMKVGMAGDKPISLQYSLTNLSPTSREISVPFDHHEFAKAIYIQQSRNYLRESWRRNQILEHGFHAGQLQETIKILAPEETISWGFSIDELVRDIDAYDALDSYHRLRIALYLPIRVFDQGEIVKVKGVSLSWVLP